MARASTSTLGLLSRVSVSATKLGSRTPLASRAATLMRGTPLTLVNSPPAKIWLLVPDVATAWTVEAARASKPPTAAPEPTSRAARHRRRGPPLLEDEPPAGRRVPPGGGGGASE